MNDTQDAAKALDEFAAGPAKDAAELSAQAFEQAAERIASALERAATSGELSFRDMAASISRDLARLALNELILDPLQSALGGIGKSGPAPTSPLNIVMNISGVKDATSFQKSQGQISAAVARAARQGQKYI